MLGGRVRRRPNAADQATRKHRPDYALILIALALLVIGLVVVYSISPGISQQKGVPESYYVSKQLIAIGLGIVAFIVLSRVPYRWWRSAVIPVVVLSVIAAIATQFFGTEVNGANRWLQIGGISFQSAELIKFALLIWLADLLALRKSQNRLADEHVTFKPLAIALLLLVGIVGLFQSDLGSTVVMVAMIAAMCYIIGVPLRRLLILGGIAAACVVLVISIFPYRRQRLATFMNPASDCQNAGYQSCQALISVGSGGLFGLGLGNSVQAYGYQPEAANDSIFAIMAEKFGFVGVSIILGLYVAFFARLSRLIERAPDDFSRLIVAGLLAWISVQAFINIGAMIGLLPLKGITLPFVSYGGTSLLFVTGALGVAFQISRYTTYGALDKLRPGEGNEDRLDGRRVGRPYNAAVSRRA
jgi:cell division protein FtsW